MPRLRSQLGIAAELRFAPPRSARVVVDDAQTLAALLLMLVLLVLLSPHRRHPRAMCHAAAALVSAASTHRQSHAPCEASTRCRSSASPYLRVLPCRTMSTSGGRIVEAATGRRRSAYSPPVAASTNPGRRATVAHGRSLGNLYGFWLRRRCLPGAPGVASCAAPRGIYSGDSIDRVRSVGSRREGWLVLAPRGSDPFTHPSAAAIAFAAAPRVTCVTCFHWNQRSCVVRKPIPVE